MNNQQAYDQWSGSYDKVPNPTRDLEAKAIRQILERWDFSESRVLEIGCGTGKNTEWLVSKARELIAADFSEEMMAVAKKRLQADNLTFVQTDVRSEWPFPSGHFDLVTCSLILEHIEDLDFFFAQAVRVLAPAGKLYIGELHPAKQYLGSKARFETGEGVFELNCFIHHTSDFLNLSHKHQLSLRVFEEWFDSDDRNTNPRLLTMVFTKPDC